jgi:hypothetical protein
MFERSELFEAPAELIERSEKKEREGASEVGRPQGGVGANLNGLI